LGYSECTVSSPTVKALQGYKVIGGLYFRADWCQPCSGFTPVLKRLYTAQAARGAHRLEIVLVSRCREAKATKYYGLGMPWLSMYRKANDEVRMKTRTTALMTKFGITTIPALVLLDKRGQVICTEGRGMCGADPEGLAFPWREQPKVGPVARAVVNFDLPSTNGLNDWPYQARILPAKRSPSESVTKKQDPVSMVNSAGGHGGGGGRLASHPFPSARPTAVVNFNLPPAKQPKKPVSPEQILPANRSPRIFFAPKQDPISAVHFAGGLSGGGGRLAGHPVPPARSTATAAAPIMDPPPNFLSS
jgi:hypothetical protein